MTPFTLDHLAHVLSARRLDASDGEVSRVSTDTRAVAPGSLFVALRGERFDAHDYLAQARDAGAVAAVVDRAPPDAPADLPLIVVADTRRALGDLARHVRGRFDKTKVVAVAGSNGKTGTKRLIHAALSSRLTGTASPKSFNNDVGVPLTLLAVEPEHDYVVVEIGTNGPGEVAHLSRIARPDVAVITNCGPEHLEGLGDLAGVRRENAAITEGMTADGTLVVNGDDPPLLEAVAGCAGRVVTFGLGEANDYRAVDVTTDFDGVGFTLDGRPVRVPMLGRHNAINALAALAVCDVLGVPAEHAIAALATATGPEMRLEVVEVNGVKVLNDAYNANPASVAAALETLRDLPHAGRKVAVLGEMLEMGDLSDRYHHEAGTLAATCGLALLAGVGRGGAIIADAAVAARFDAANVRRFNDAESAGVALAGELAVGDLVLLKASRGVRLERVLNALQAVRERGSDR